MEYSEKPLQKEHAYNQRERSEARRKLIGKKVKTVIAAGAMAATFLGVGKAIEENAESKYQPDSYYNGSVEVVLSENLNIREAPIVISNDSEPPNTVDWNQIDEINGVKIEGAEKIIINNPVITEGDDPASIGGESPWITLKAKVEQAIGDPREETLYINFSGATTDYVKPIESGSFIKLSGEPAANLGNVSIGSE